MPDMMEIYQKHADMYDRLVSSEDRLGNLQTTLLELVDWNGKSVVEAGLGTGRVTALYIEKAARVWGLDGSAHMLEQAGRNLSAYGAKLDLRVCDNRELLSALAGVKADIFVQGWSFGHTVSEHAEEIPLITRRLVEQAAGCVKKGGTILFLETLGTNVDQPVIPAPFLEGFYGELEEHGGFERRTLATDYEFGDLDEAVEVMGFFFGPEMAESVQKRGTKIVPEFTGIWTKRL